MLPKNFDQLRMGDLLRILSSSSAQDYTMALQQLKERFGKHFDPLLVAQTTWQRAEWAQLLRDGACFSSTMANAAQGVGKTQFAQLLNPATQAKNILIFAVDVSLSDATDLVTLARDDVAEVGANMGSQNLLAGSAAVTDNSTQKSANGTNPANAAGQTDSKRVLVNTRVRFASPSPDSPLIELPPGTGIIVSRATQNTPMDVTFFYALVPAVGASSPSGSAAADLPVSQGGNSSW